MTDLVFVDSNILVYAHDRTAGAKRERAIEVIEELWVTGRGRLSTQVLQELYVNVTRKLESPLTHLKAREVIKDLGQWVREPTTSTTVIRAIDLAELAKLNFWDGLILAAAEQSNATILYSEDLNHGQVIAGIKVVNPLVDTRDVKN
jgi:predicted nucleic acid-binding protein